MIYTEYTICEPVVDMREFPTLESKVVSQALWGESVTLEREEGDWLWIATPDGYKGWISPAAIVKRSERYSSSVEVTRLRAHLYGIPDTEFGPLKTLPFGARLICLEGEDARWVKVLLPNGKEGYVQKGDIVPERAVAQKEELALFSKKFLGLPYTWGGRSSFGYDCSGFVQMLYSRLGVSLPRDAREQILSPLLRPVSIENLATGDLIFFGKSEAQIRHVGMSLGGSSFIHTSSRENKPYLRLSDLSDEEWSGSEKAFYPFRAARAL